MANANQDPVLIVGQSRLLWLAIAEARSLFSLEGKECHRARTSLHELQMKLMCKAIYIGSLGKNLPKKSTAVLQKQGSKLSCQFIIVVLVLLFIIARIWMSRLVDWEHFFGTSVGHLAFAVEG